MSHNIFLKKLVAAYYFECFILESSYRLLVTVRKFVIGFMLKDHARALWKVAAKVGWGNLQLLAGHMRSAIVK